MPIKIYLRVYELETMISSFVDSMQIIACKWNHCSIRADKYVIHCFDHYDYPKWISIKVEEKIFGKEFKQEFYVGEYFCMDDLGLFCDKLRKPTQFEIATRQLWWCSLGLWQKQNDCVHKCSSILNYMFNIPMCYSTPEKLAKLAQEYEASKKRLCWIV